LNSQIDEISNSHSFAVETLQSLRQELAHERSSSKRLSLPFPANLGPSLNESDFQNISVDCSGIEDTNDHNVNDESRFNLQDELGTLDIEGNNFNGDDPSMFYSQNSTLYELNNNDDYELGQLLDDNPFDKA